MSHSRIGVLAAMLLVTVAGSALAQASAPMAASYDAALAKELGADERGMRSYVLVILKTGPTKVPAGDERDEMFKGHFANIERLAKAGKLAVAGPFAGGENGWRGLYLFAVSDLEEARALVATDPVIVKGEMVGEFHKWYGSAALMIVPQTHDKLVRKQQ
jgi:uncharacterized protein YciI